MTKGIMIFQSLIVVMFILFYIKKCNILFIEAKLNYLIIYALI